MYYSIKDKLAGVVILYNQDPKETLQNLLTYAESLNKIYIIDNSTDKKYGVDIIMDKLGSKIEYFFDGQNEGIAKRLNFAAEYAIKDGYDFLLTMDQDSSFPNCSFDIYLEEISNCSIDNVAQFGVNSQPLFTKQNLTAQVVNFLITSGSIIILKHFIEIGKFNEHLFIDFVDIDFSFRINNAKLKNIQYTNIILTHQIGELVLGRSLQNFKITKRIIHSPIRVYYIVRNGLFLIFKTKNLNISSKIEIFKRMKILKNNYLYHPYLFKVYLCTLNGILDFFRNKMGKK